MLAEIARKIRRHRSVVTREIARNSVGGEYQSGIAQGRAEARRGGKSSKVDGGLMFEVIDLLCDDHSPEQVSMALARRGRKLSFQTIYNRIHLDRGRGGELWRLLRHHGKRERSEFAYADSIERATGCRLFYA